MISRREGRTADHRDRSVRCICLSAVVLLVAAGIGCHAHRCVVEDIAAVSEGRLTFLQDGRTTRDDVEAVLGAPSGRFEGGRILTFRLDKSYEVVTDTGVVVAPAYRYSLVLVFDSEGFLVRHRLLRIR